MEGLGSYRSHCMPPSCNNQPGPVGFGIPPRRRFSDDRLPERQPRSPRMPRSWHRRGAVFHFARPKPPPAETLPGLPRPPAIPVHAATHRRRTGSGRSRGSDGSGLDIVDRKGGLLSPQPVMLSVRDDGPRHRCARQMAKLACRHQASCTSAMSLRRQEGRLLIRDLRSTRFLYAQIECTVLYADLHEATFG